MYLIFLIPNIAIYAQNSSNSSTDKLQAIYGQVRDIDSGAPLEGVSLLIPDSDPQLFTTSDKNGYYKIKNVPLGEISLFVTSINYKDKYINNIQIVSGKSALQNIYLEEDIISLKEVVISSGNSQKEEELSISSKRFDATQTARYAAAFGDPSRMAASFAGVQNVTDSRNDIIVRGNSPLGLLWRLDDIDIPNPNHFGSFGSTGGPVSILNNNTLDNSLFFTGAFPAAYGNASSAVFDLNLKNGNYHQTEFLGQLGFNGLEAGIEGPISKKNKSSYLLNARYSTLETFDALGLNIGLERAVPRYQDVTFKINFPTARGGSFYVMGIFGGSNVAILESESLEDSGQNVFSGESEDIYTDSNVGVLGVGYKHFFNDRISLKIAAAHTYQGFSARLDSVVWNQQTNEIIDKIRYISGSTNQEKQTVHLRLVNKIDARNELSIGNMINHYQSQFVDSTLVNPTTDRWRINTDENGRSTLIQSYLSWQHKFSNKVKLNTGIRHLYFSLNGESGFEPRVRLQYTHSAKHELSIGYGLHHQLLPFPVYFKQNQNGQTPNTELKMSKSAHIVAQWNYKISEKLIFNLELYNQQLSRIAVEDTVSSFSLINIGSDFDTPNNTNLVSNGAAHNYGFELSLSKKLLKGYYWLANISVFQSKYRGSDDILRNSAFNNNFVLNGLFGKEWRVKGTNQIRVDARLTLSGGRYYSPIDIIRSNITGDEVIIDQEAFSLRYPSYFRSDLKIFYRVNRKKTTHEFGIEIQNLTNHQNVFSRRYDERTMTERDVFQLGIIPVPQYRFLF
ncbi:MAG: TonB-dependent receptor [Bacteroidota bacterium]